MRVDASVVVSGGTGGLGSAVTRTLLEAGWSVVVPYVDEHELARVEDHERLTLVPADLFDADAAKAVIAAAPEPLGALVNLVGGYAAGGRVHE
ncbi:MAG: SDR family NAD(P)-dependent oxidoreductase, partial [Solirubrobacteraceae bacterium]